MTEIQLKVDDNGYIVNPAKELIHGKIILKLNGNHNEIKIGNSFLVGCSGLTEIDLSGLKEVKSIGSHFLYYCSGLDEIKCDGYIKKELKEKYEELSEKIVLEICDEDGIEINDDTKIEI